jgi:ankyrin repeat protein
LLYAAEYDYPRVIRELSFKGLDLDLTDNEGKTAVSYANKNRSMDALCELIGEWARFNLDEIDGKAALLYAAEHDNSRVIRQFYFLFLQ